MTADGLLLDHAPGETRAGWFQGGRLVAMELIRSWAVAGEGLVAGQRFTARLLAQRSPGLALVDLGCGQAVLRPAPRAAEGSLIAVELTHAPLPELGRTKPARVALAAHEVAQAPGWQGQGDALHVFLARLGTAATTIYCTSASLAARVGAVGRDAVLVTGDPRADQLDEALATAPGGVHPIMGGLVTLQRTRAGLIIDVDASGDPVQANARAAKEIARLLRLYGIGGAVLVDFIGQQTKAERQALAAAFDDAMADAPVGWERTAINGYGLMQVILPRRGPSVLDQLIGERLAGLSQTSQALALLRMAWRTTGPGTRRIIAPPPVAQLLERWPAERAELAAELAAPVIVVADPSVPGYGRVDVN